MHAQETVSIGVLAKRGQEKSIEKWSETAAYLTNKIDGYTFHIKPLGFDEIDHAVTTGSIDFILVNSGIYVSLEYQHGVSRIATLKNRIGAEEVSLFGGVIFSRADNQNLARLEDIKGKRFAAVDMTSLGGFQTAWGELQSHNIDPFRDCKGLQFFGTHDAVVMAVLHGRADVGTVRTDTLERMADEGSISLDQIHVFTHGSDTHAIGYLHSTQLYPEWPMAKLAHTPLELAEHVAISLIEMPSDSPAAKASKTAGWTIPLNYQPVHQLFQDLKLPPYEPKPISLYEFLQQHKPLPIIVLAAIFSILLATLQTMRSNKHLKTLSLELQKARDELEVKVDERTRELAEKEQELESLFENIPSVVFVKDTKKLRFVRLNKAAENLTGKTREEIIGHDVYDFFPKEQADSFTSSDKQVVKSGEIVTLEQEPIQTADGLRYLDTRKVCVLDSEGNPKYLLGISNDVTEIKAAREKIDHLATHDALTGLYNRRVLEEHLEY